MAEGARGSLYGTTPIRGHVPAIVSLEGHAAANLDLWVHDEQGNLVCANIGSASHESCSFTPEWTASYTIPVGNSNQLDRIQYTLWLT